jgi:hypothetical protein
LENDALATELPNTSLRIEAGAMRKSKAATAYDYQARPDGCSSKPCCAAR